MNNVTIVDFDSSNLRNVTRAFDHCGSKLTVTDSPYDILKADRLVLPGVGSFRTGMEKLKSRNLLDPILEFSRTERPLLGICLGMQMLMESSEEFGLTDGLGLIEGSVKAIPSTYRGSPITVPHTGWNLLRPANSNATFRNTIFESNCDPYVYFVHSYVANPNIPSDVLATVKYHGLDIVAAVQKDNVVGCQFHPEKSGKTGVGILQKFLTS